MSGLTIGSLALSPAFDSDMPDYTATTANATNTVTATPTDPASVVTIKINGAEIDNGTAATWEDGENSVDITVANGSETEVYTVTVTKQ